MKLSFIPLSKSYPLLFLKSSLKKHIKMKNNKEKKMTDPICVLMGIADIIAGVLIILGFGINSLAIVFGIVMIVKGGMSFL